MSGIVIRLKDISTFCKVRRTDCYAATVGNRVWRDIENSTARAATRIEELEAERDRYKAMVMSHDLLKQSADLLAENGSLRDALRKAQEALVRLIDNVETGSYESTGQSIDEAHATLAEIEKVLK